MLSLKNMFLVLCAISLGISGCSEVADYQSSVEAGGAVIVKDTLDTEKTAKALAAEVLRLMKDDNKREEMSRAGKGFAKADAAEALAKKIIAMR